MDSPDGSQNGRETMIRRSIFSQRSFERMARGVWFRVLPTEDAVDSICDAMHQDWEDLLPLLIDHGLLAVMLVTTSKATRPRIMPGKRSERFIDRYSTCDALQ